MRSIAFEVVRFARLLVYVAVGLVVGAGLPSLSSAEAPATSEQRVFPVEADYDPAIPRLSEFLGFRYGEQPATPQQIQEFVERLGAVSDRVSVESYGETYEGRPLLLAIISSPDRQKGFAEIKASLAAIASGSAPGVSLDSLPVVLWIGASVHGNETSGADAALGLLYHLAADRTAQTNDLLDQVLVVLDPLQNPDGRARMLADLTQWSSRIPNVDHQSLQHRSEWPSPRGNHYFLDLNRDWFALSQPETRAKVRVLLEWRPQVTIDLHEMGSFDTYLISPPREPMNPYLPSSTHDWWRTFSRAQAIAFGQRGWSCYSGDWNEEFNPNRGASWPLFTGAVAILEEQASADGAQIRVPEGSILSHHDAVARQFVATLTVIKEAAGRRQMLLQSYLENREQARGGLGSEGAFLVDRSTRGRVAQRLAETLRAQGIEVQQTTAPVRLPEVSSCWGESSTEMILPAGSYVIPYAQPEGRLARAILDFDPPIGSDFLTKERVQLEGGGSSLLYESTAWSLAMAYGVEIYRTEKPVRVRSIPFEPSSRASGTVIHPDAPYGFLLDSNDSGAIAGMVRLFASGIMARGAGERFVVDGRIFDVGTILIRRAENGTNLVDSLQTIARETGAVFHGVTHPLTDEGPDLGGRRFELLQEPRVAILSSPQFYYTTFGAIWHLLDQELGLPASILRLGGLAQTNLDKYNVIIVPDGSPGSGETILGVLGSEGRGALSAWIQRGGTLLTLGEGATILFEGEEPIGGLRARRQVLDQLDRYEADRRRSLRLQKLAVDEEALLHRKASPVTVEIELGPQGDMLSAEEDEWLRRFSPQGAILRANLDSNHWLTSGVGGRVPVLVKTDLALMSMQPLETVGRFAEPEELRLSGLLWPEARERWSGTTYLARERIGEGQAISFLGNPYYRAYFLGTGRLLVNAILLGPGMGARTRPGW